MRRMKYVHIWICRCVCRNFKKNVLMKLAPFCDGWYWLTDWTCYSGSFFRESASMVSLSQPFTEKKKKREMCVESTRVLRVWVQTSSVLECLSLPRMKFSELGSSLNLSCHELNKPNPYIQAKFAYTSPATTKSSSARLPNKPKKNEFKLAFLLTNWVELDP